MVPAFSLFVYTNGLLAKMIQRYFIILSTLKNTGVQPTSKSGNVSPILYLTGDTKGPEPYCSRGSISLAETLEHMAVLS